MSFEKAYVVAVNMGYGHERAAFPLLDIATLPKEWDVEFPTVISANNYPNIPWIDKWRWERTRKTYEFISRIRPVPILGKLSFVLLDFLQKIEPFYPRRDLSYTTFPVRLTHRMIKNGLGKHLVEILNKDPLPLITTFPIPAIFAEEHGYKGDIYCLCTDSDIARSWAPIEPAKSRITYFAPNLRVQERLRLYGVRAEKIVLSGFPLPKEVLGDDSLNVLKESLGRRISKLDPKGTFQKKNEKLLNLYLGPDWKKQSYDSPLTITFAIGGAGAQSDIALDVLTTFADKIKKMEIKLNLVAGTSKAIKEKFEHKINELDLRVVQDRSIRIIYSEDKFEYFKEFNWALVSTDILWTKPSELSFYVGLGIPIIMSPALGEQEECNRSWLHMMGAGFEQYDPKYAKEWLYDWIDSGWLAEAALYGFQNAPKRAYKHITDLVLHGNKTEIEDVHFV